MTLLAVAVAFVGYGIGEHFPRLCRCGCGADLEGRSTREFMDRSHAKRAARQSARFWRRYSLIRRRPRQCGGGLPTASLSTPHGGL